MAKNREEGILVTYPKHRMAPEDTIDFIEMSGWSNDCKRLGLNEVELLAMRVGIMSGPDRAPIIKGTGGLRKMRFAPARWETGKRGAARVCYVYFKDYDIVLLVKIYSKNEKANLSAADRATLKKAINMFKTRLRQGPIS